MDRKIYCITEAYSSQPTRLRVGDDIVVNGLRVDQIHDIRLETVSFAEGGKTVYAGYNSKREKLFEYLAVACNVHYFVS